MHDVILRI